MRSRLVGVVTLLLLAPITAELLQAYLGDLGGPLGLIGFVVFMAPLYGGAALLIREISVRTGRGWPGRLLLATAFGVAMPTIIDVSLFTTARDDIDGWSEIVGAAPWGGLGWSAVVAWVGGHVLMSIGAPTVVAETLAARPGPWLGRLGLGVPVIGFLGVALALHRDQTSHYTTDAGWSDYGGAAVVVAVLVAVACSPLGRPLTASAAAVPRPGFVLVLGWVAMAGFDLVPQSWAGVVIGVGILAAAGLLLGRWGRSTRWSARHLAALVTGVLLARTLLAFTTPLPPGLTMAQKTAQNTAWLVLVLALGWAMWRRTRSLSAAAPAQPSATTS